MINSLLSACEFFEKTALFKPLHQTWIDEIFRLCRCRFGSSDDHDAARELMMRILEKQGHAIRSTPDAKSAISVGKKLPTGPGFSRYQTTDMTGDELLRRLKEIDGASGTKFVGLSGFRAVDTPESVEFDHFLEKPVQREKLDAILASSYVDTPKIR